MSRELFLLFRCEEYMRMMLFRLYFEKSFEIFAIYHFTLGVGEGDAVEPLKFACGVPHREIGSEEKSFRSQHIDYLLCSLGGDEWQG